MIPLEKVKQIVSTYETLEKELASSDIGKKDFVKKSKEYSAIGGIIDEAKGYLDFEKEKLELDKIIRDKKSDKEMIQLAKSELNELLKKKQSYEKILKSLNLRHKGVNIISCPSCARQGFPVIDIVKILEEKLSHIKEPITLSIIGCVVNGPGEASQTQIGLTGGGQGSHMMYLSGLPHHKVANDKIIEEVVTLVENKSKELKSN